jgi:hypothetical protein
MRVPRTGLENLEELESFIADVLNIVAPAGRDVTDVTGLIARKYYFR